jgi:hypothetical protein
MKFICVAFHNNSVTGITPALIANNHIGIFSQKISYFRFAFITKLGTNHYYVCQTRRLAEAAFAADSIKTLDFSKFPKVKMSDICRRCQAFV